MLGKLIIIPSPRLAMGVEVGFQPGANFLAKGFFFRGIGKIHAAGLLVVIDGLH
jgi:hypothetical protein